MEGLDIVQLITTWGWKAAVIGAAVFLFIEVFKPLIRKVIKSEAGRHVFYSIIDIVLVAASCYLWISLESHCWNLDYKALATMFTAAYSVLKIIYPVYSNLGLQAAIKAIFGAIFCHRKEIAKEVEKQQDKKQQDKKVIEL